MIITKAPIVKCKKCQKLYNLEVDDFDEPETTSEERNMGYETQYVWEYEHICDNCSNKFEVTIEGYEYPEGFFNYEETNYKNCVMVAKPELEINNDEL